MRGIDFTGIAYLAAIGIAGYIAWRVWQAGPKTIADATQAVKVAAAAVVDSVNPASDTNLVNQAADAAVQKVTGGAQLSIGSWAYDLMNPDPLKVIAPDGTAPLSWLDRMYPIGNAAPPAMSGILGQSPSSMF